ncbi:MAG: hypothetical protein RL748_4593 [Pseudomonadota bacterium]|jgi:ribosomal protein S18 acetylase RimI-like enzyme
MAGKRFASRCSFSGKLWFFEPFATMLIRSATAPDAPVIAQVHVESWQHAYRDCLPFDYLANLSVDARCKMWQGAIAKGAPRVWVADVDGKIAGFVAIGPSRDEGALPDAFEVWAIYLAPAYWGQGVGRELMQTAREFCVQSAASSVSLWVIVGNQRAIGFYRSLGFEAQPDSVCRFELGGASLQEMRYVLSF